MTADELHALAARTRDAARLAERHGTSAHGYRRAAREACERMGEMSEQLAEAEERAREAEQLVAEAIGLTPASERDRLRRERDEARDVARCEASLRARWEQRTEEARDELRDLVAALGQDDGPRAKAIQHARAVLEEWGMR